MKIIAIGDTHGHSSWKLILKETADLFIFIGDYFDSFIFSGAEQIYNFKELMRYREQNPDKFIFLRGNHDHYDWDTYGDVISGYQRNNAHLIKEILSENKQHLKIAHSVDNILFTHAGVSEDWLELTAKSCGLDIPNYTAKEICDFVNLVFENKPDLLAFNGENPYGDDLYQTPLWIRPKSLIKSNQILKKSIIQVVGHTAMKSIDMGKATGGRYYFIDTLGTSKEYLIIEDGEFKTNTI